MYDFPTKTTALKPFNTDKTTEALNQAFVKQRDNEFIEPLVHGTAKSGCYVLKPTNTEVPMFTLPHGFTATLGKTTQESRQDLCIDIRPFTRTDARGTLIVSNRTEYNFHCDVAVLTRLWLDGSFYVVTNNSLEVLLKCFARWIGTALNQRMNTEDTVQSNVLIITAFYQYCILHPDLEVISEEKLIRLSMLISKATFANINTVKDLLPRLPIMRNIDDFVGAIKEHSGTQRFEKLTPGFIYTMVQYTWYGSSNTVITSASLEYPPLFTAMVFNALFQDGYRKTMIGKVAKDLPRQETDHFIKTVEALIYK